MKHITPDTLKRKTPLPLFQWANTQKTRERIRWTVDRNNHVAAYRREVLFHG